MCFENNGYHFEQRVLTAATSYTFTVRAKDAAGNLSATSNSLTVVNSNNTATDLFSEYIGSSNNKALEISNATSSSQLIHLQHQNKAMALSVEYRLTFIWNLEFW
jgi:hypothetical protein